MAMQKYVDGLKDYFTQQVFLMQDPANLDAVRYRCKMKAGVSTLLTTGMTGIMWGVDRGEGSGVSRNTASGLPCEQYVTFFFKPGTSTFRNGAYLKNAVIGAFLSQFETVYDPFPEWIGSMALDQKPIPILSPEFTAPAGLFDFPELNDSNFSGSTFKVGPKIFTDRVLKEFVIFPANKSTGVWRPFQGCAQMKSIAQQGEFGELLEYVGRCDFTYYDAEGFGKLDAYPSGGAPQYIYEYVNATKIKFSERFPTFDSKRLDMSVHPFKIDSIVIDSTGGPTLPFGGIDYSKAPATMSKLWLYNPKWTVDLPLQPKDQMTFTFGWGSLGITAPSACKDIANLHTLWQNTTLEGADCFIATPEALKTRIHFGWGSALDSVLRGNPGKVTADMMPLVPAGVQRIESYYCKYNIGLEDDVFSGRAEMGSMKLKSKLDGAAYCHKVQALPTTAIDVLGYCMNLYSDYEISTAITIPALSSNLRYARDCYRRTFYNAVGKPKPIAPLNREPTVLIAYSKSSASTRLPFKVIANATAAYNGDFKKYLATQKFSSIVKRAATDGQGFLKTEPWTTYDQLIAGVKAPGVATVEIRVIDAPIILERNSYSSLQFAGGWQEECFFGAGIDPRAVDAVIATPQKKEWNSYRRVLNISLSHSFGQPLEMWTGEIRIPSEFINETDRDVRFMVLVSYGGFDAAQFDPYRYQLNSIIFNGPARTENTTAINPYFQATSKDTIQGDRTAFLAAKGIVLSPPEDFSTGMGTAVTTFVQFSGVPIGLQAAQFSDPQQALADARVGWSFIGSYLKRPGRFGDDFLKKTTINSYYFEPPLWVDSDGMRRLGVNTELSISNQSDLNSAVSTINGA